MDPWVRPEGRTLLFKDEYRPRKCQMLGVSIVEVLTLPLGFLEGIEELLGNPRFSFPQTFTHDNRMSNWENPCFAEIHLKLGLTIGEETPDLRVTSAECLRNDR